MRKMQQLMTPELCVEIIFEGEMEISSKFASERMDCRPEILQLAACSLQEFLPATFSATIKVVAVVLGAVCDPNKMPTTAKSPKPQLNSCNLYATNRQMTNCMGKNAERENFGRLRTSSRLTYYVSTRPSKIILPCSIVK
jgi:hypothetical protein